MALRLLAVLAAGWLSVGRGSAGDRDPVFRRCLAAEGDAYACMMDISRDRLRRGLPLLQ